MILARRRTARRPAGTLLQRQSRARRRSVRLLPWRSTGLRALGLSARNSTRASRGLLLLELQLPAVVRRPGPYPERLLPRPVRGWLVDPHHDAPTSSVVDEIEHVIPPTTPGAVIRSSCSSMVPALPLGHELSGSARAESSRACARLIEDIRRATTWSMPLSSPNLIWLPGREGRRAGRPDPTSRMRRSAIRPTISSPSSRTRAWTSTRSSSCGCSRNTPASARGASRISTSPASPATTPSWAPSARPRSSPSSPASTRREPQARYLAHLRDRGLLSAQPSPPVPRAACRVVRIRTAPDVAARHLKPAS